MKLDPVLNICHDAENISAEEAVIIHTDLLDGFKCAIPDVSFTQIEFKKILKDIKESFPDIVEYNYSRNQTTIYKKYMSDQVRLYIRGNSVDLFGSFYTTCEEDNIKLWNIYNEHSASSNDIQMFMHSFSMNGPAVDESIRLMKLDELDYISDLYYPYIDTGVMFDQFFTGNENILLLVGAPGLGKSKLSTLALKYAYNNPDKLPYDKLEDNPALDNQFISCGFVKSTDVLANDAFWRTLEKSPPDFCIIDDLDYMLTKRDAEVQSSDDVIKNSFLNQFLSFTDGVEKHKTKFIITTNQNYSDIDAALLRKGRLFDILELRKLDRTEASKIWQSKDLDMADFERLFQSHEVLPAELGSEINKRLNKRINTATKSYLKEDGISKVLTPLSKKITL